jgi:uncharacterized protein (TIGR02594 family)
MVVSSALRRSLVALAMCSAAIAVSSSSASARAYNHGTGHAHARHVVHLARAYVHYRHHRSVTRASRWERGVAMMRSRGLADAQASVAPASESTMSGGLGGGSDLASEARRYLGGNPTGRGSLWCARFMNMVLEHTGHRGTGSDMANSFASYGHNVSGPQVGAIAVMGRRGGGHVGIITGVDAQGNPIMISGNNGNRVREAKVSRGRIYAYVMPN